MNEILLGILNSIYTDDQSYFESAVKVNKFNAVSKLSKNKVMILTMKMIIIKN